MTTSPTSSGGYLPHVLTRFERRAAERGMRYAVGAPASADAISRAEERLEIAFPPEVAASYARWNGLSVDDPPLEVVPLERLAFVAPGLLHFATAAGESQLCFDTTRLNEAGQWSVVAAAYGYEVTQTLGSFWSNKIWKWLDERCAFWTPWPWKPQS